GNRGLTQYTAALDAALGLGAGPGHLQQAVLALVDRQGIAALTLILRISFIAVGQSIALRLFAGRTGLAQAGGLVLMSLPGIAALHVKAVACLDVGLGAGAAAGREGGRRAQQGAKRDHG